MSEANVVNPTTKGSVVKRLVMFFLRALWWLLPRMAVILAIGVGVEWGGMFHQPWRWLEGIASWALVWAAIDYYKWHTNRYET